MAEFYRKEYVEAIRAVDGKWYVIDDEGKTTTWEHEKFIRTFRPMDGVLCEGCGNYIDMYKDVYYEWDEGIYTCEICGGPEGHLPVQIQRRLD